MDINKAKEIISALSEGIDPTTGEILPDDSVCNKGDVVRAFYAILNCLDKKSKKDIPKNAGKAWTSEEEKRLRELYSSGLSKKEISSELCRTTGSVSSRLSRLGLIND